MNGVGRVNELEVAIDDYDGLGPIDRGEFGNVDFFRIRIFFINIQSPDVL